MNKISQVLQKSQKLILSIFIGVLIFGFFGVKQSFASVYYNQPDTSGVMTSRGSFNLINDKYESPALGAPISVDTYYWSNDNPDVYFSFWLKAPHLSDTALDQFVMINSDAYGGSTCASYLITPSDVYLLQDEQYHFFSVKVPSISAFCHNSSGLYLGAYKMGSGASLLADVTNAYPTTQISFDTFPTSGVDTSTHIISFNPANNSVATSGMPVSINVSAYINPADLSWLKGISVWIKNGSQNGIIESLLYNQEWYFPISDISGGGQFDFSTTTMSIPDGNYIVEVFLNTNYLGGSVNNIFSQYKYGSASQDNSNPLAQYHQYIVGTSSALGSILQGQNNEFESILSATTSSSTISISSCNILSGFDFGKCMTYAFVPSDKQVKTFINNLNTSVFTHFPFGYVTRLYDIIIGNTTSTLPTLSITIPTGMPDAGATLDLTPWGKLMGEGSLLATATSSVTGVTFYNSFSDYWKAFVYFVFGLMVCLEIIGMNSVISVDTSKKDKNNNKIK